MVLREKVERTIQQMVEKLREDYAPQKVILFGSRARGMARPNSDIDLLVIKETSERFIGWRVLFKTAPEDHGLWPWGEVSAVLLRGISEANSAKYDRTLEPFREVCQHRQYQIIKKCGWEYSNQTDGTSMRCAWHVLSKDGKEQESLFFIGCAIFFGGKIYLNNPNEIPEELATLTIQWLLEEAGQPPVDAFYRGVFTQRGLRHRAGQPEDQQFGDDICPTLEDVVKRLRRKWLEAKDRGRQIGFHPSHGGFWTQQSEIAEHV